MYANVYISVRIFSSEILRVQFEIGRGITIMPCFESGTLQINNCLTNGTLFHVILFLYTESGFHLYESSPYQDRKDNPGDKRE